MTEWVEPEVEATLTLQQTSVSGVSTVYKGKGAFILTLRGQLSPHAKPKRIMVGAPADPATLAPEEEGYMLRDNDYIPLSADALVGELTEEE